ncbi:MAG TPA: hypothetical protein VFV10_09985 [Gammaproteobacteria bacterium]|nr:hypothetical protein [Gammaproteobacteria bacterium]
MQKSMTSKRIERPGSGALASALRDTLALLLLTAAVWLLHVYGRTLPTAALGALWTAMTIVVTAGLFRRARIRRGAFLAAYVNPASPLARLLRGGWIMATWWLVVAAAASLVLMVALIRLDDREDWAVLVASAPLLVLVHGVVRRFLATHVEAAYLPEPAWRVTWSIVGFAMFAALVTLAFYRSYPDLEGVSLERAVWYFVNAEHARSLEAQFLLQAAAAKDALRLWLAQQLMPRPGASPVQALGWGLVLAEQAVFVWSYLLLGSGVLLGFRTYDPSDARQP